MLLETREWHMMVLLQDANVYLNFQVLLPIESNFHLHNHHLPLAAAVSTHQR